MWQSYQENMEEITDHELIKYQQYLVDNKLVDSASLWQNIINEQKPCKTEYVFYGFANLKPNIAELITKLQIYSQCKIYNPIVMNKNCTLVQHESSYAELAWLSQELARSNSRTLVICQDASKLLTIVNANKVKVNAITGVNLTATFMVKTAIKLLEICQHDKLKKTDWLPLLRYKFSKDTSLDEWQALNISCLDHLKAKTILSPEIYTWILTIRAFVEQLPATATYLNWARDIQQLLTIAGWPFIKHITPSESALFNFWQTNLASWANQDLMATTEIDFKSAIVSLKQNCQETTFRTNNNPESHITVANIKELDGFTAEKIIILNATNKLVNSEAELRFKQWQSQAIELIFSQAMTIKNETSQTFAPLIKYGINTIKSNINKNNVATYYRPFKEQVITSGPKVINSKILHEHAQCPIKAVFNSMSAQHKPLPEFNNSNELAIVRGIVVHEVMAKFWQKIKNSENLKQLTAKDLETMLAKLIKSALISESKYLADMQNQLVLSTEHSYLLALIKKFIDFERDRDDFTVVEIESDKVISIANHALKVRLDRVDSTNEGLHLIDYKTGAVNPSDWLGTPPSAPQMPLYLSDNNINYDNASYACINKNFIGFKGYEQIRKKPDWPEFIADAKAGIQALIKELESKTSKTAPKTNTTCNNCNLKSICRPNSIIETIDYSAIN